MIKKSLLILLASVQLYAGIQLEGPSSENIIIRWAFQELCDHHYDPQWVYPTPTKNDKSADFKASDVKPGDMIFVRDCKYFFKHKHKKIKVPYFILTHGEYLDKFKQKYFKYLKDENILAWFTIHPCDIEYERVIPLPIGIMQYKGLRDKKKKTLSRFKKLRERKKDKLLYMNFTEWRMPERTRIRKLFQKKAFCTYSKKCTFRQYLDDLSRHKFVLSPPGLGPDCYRVWESVLAGSIPIVQHSHMDFMYEGLPVLFINDWEDITEAFLKKKYKEMTLKVY